MRTIEEIRYYIDHRPDEGTYGYRHAQDIAHDEGFEAGMRKAMALVEAGETNEAIYQFAQNDQKAYTPHGDDCADAYQSGYTTALEWAAERFDWDEEGTPHFRNDVWGETPVGW